jgi:hypothetical protein
MYSLRFELFNHGSAPVEFSMYEPFTTFTVLATAAEEPLTVHQPALDIPINSTIVRVPPGGTHTLVTPIQLRILEGAEPGTDGFIWTIAEAKEKVSLQIKLNLPDPFDLVCPVSFGT